MYKLFRLLILFCFCILPYLQASADAIVINKSMFASTIAEFYVEEDQVRVRFEVSYSDLNAFQNLLPNEIYQDMGLGDKPLKERVDLFFKQDFPLYADGKAIQGYVTKMEPQDRIKRDAITGEPLPVNNEEKETVILVELLYPFDKKPENLTLFTLQKKPVNIGFVAYHKKIAINDFNYLGNDYQLTLNWDDPWYSAFNNKRLRRQYYAPMSGFIYIEPYEVRKEIILRPRDLQNWIDLGLNDNDVIPVVNQAEIKRKVVEFLADKFPVTIDGKAVQGQLDRINFLQRSLNRSTVVDNQEQDLNSAMLGIIYSFPTHGLPQKVTMDWDLWDEKITEIPAAAVDQAGPFKSLLQPDWHVLEWVNFLKNPEIPSLIDIERPPAQYLIIIFWLLSVLFLFSLLYLIHLFRKETPISKQVLVALISMFLLTGSVYFNQKNSVNSQQIEKLVANLLHNIYRAFDYRDEEAIYDTLNHSVTGELLTDIYLQTRRSLVLANQGGARAKVKSLELVGTKNLTYQDDGFTVDTTWNVFGSVGHWGHVHKRTNQYEARLSFKPDNGQWKLASMEIYQEQRL